MTTYVVSFMPKDDAERAKLTQVLRTFPGVCPIHNYCWSIMANNTATEVRDKITAAAPNAKVFVMKSSGAAAWRGSFGEKHNEWLKKNL